MKVKLLKDVDTTCGPMSAGTVVDHHEAGWLVLLGIAEPIDTPLVDGRGQVAVTLTCPNDSSASAEA